MSVVAAAAVVASEPPHKPKDVEPPKPSSTWFLSQLFPQLVSSIYNQGSRFGLGPHVDGPRALEHLLSEEAVCFPTYP